MEMKKKRRKAEEEIVWGTMLQKLIHFLEERIPKRLKWMSMLWIHSLNMEFLYYCLTLSTNLQGLM
jgi:hypothetical protein